MLVPTRRALANAGVEIAVANAAAVVLAGSLLCWAGRLLAGQLRLGHEALAPAAPGAGAQRAGAAAAGSRGLQRRGGGGASQTQGDPGSTTRPPSRLSPGRPGKGKSNEKERLSRAGSPTTPRPGNTAGQRWQRAGAVRGTIPSRSDDQHDVCDRGGIVPAQPSASPAQAARRWVALARSAGVQPISRKWGSLPALGRPARAACGHPEPFRCSRVLRSCQAPILLQ